MIKQSLFLIASVTLHLSRAGAAENCVELFSLPNPSLKSPVVQEYLQRTVYVASRKELAQIVRELDQTHQLSFEDFITIHNSGNLAAFALPALRHSLSSFSQKRPLTLDQIENYLKPLSVEQVADVFKHITRKEGHLNSPIYFTGTNADFINFFKQVVSRFKSSSSKDDMLYLGTQLFGSSSERLLKELDLTPTELSDMLGVFPTLSIDFVNAQGLFNVIGFQKLTHVDSELLFSRLYFTLDKNGGLIWALALAQETSFLVRLQEGNYLSHFPRGVLDAVLREKNLSTESSDKVTENLGRSLFIKELDTFKVFEQEKYTESVSYRYYRAQILAQSLISGSISADYLNAYFTVLTEIQRTPRFRDEYNNTDIPSTMVEILPRLKNIPVLQIWPFYRALITYYEVSNLAITLPALLRYGADILTLQTSTYEVTYREVELYFNLRRGGVVKVARPNVWQTITSAKLPAMSHQEAVEYLRLKIAAQ